MIVLHYVVTDEDEYVSKPGKGKQGQREILITTGVGVEALLISWL